MNLQIKASDQKVILNIPEANIKDEGAGLPLSELLNINTAQTFYVRVTGNIYPELNLKKGDVLIVDRSAQPTNNTLVVSVKEEGFGLSKVTMSDNKIYLIPENGATRPIEIVPTMDFTIWGVVTHIISKL